MAAEAELRTVRQAVLRQEDQQVAIADVRRAGVSAGARVAKTPTGPGVARTRRGARAGDPAQRSSIPRLAHPSRRDATLARPGMTRRHPPDASRTNSKTAEARRVGELDGDLPSVKPAERVTKRIISTVGRSSAAADALCVEKNPTYDVFHRATICIRCLFTRFIRWARDSTNRPPRAKPTPRAPRAPLFLLSSGTSAHRETLADSRSAVLAGSKVFAPSLRTNGCSRRTAVG